MNIAFGIIEFEGMLVNERNFTVIELEFFWISQVLVEYLI